MPGICPRCDKNVYFAEEKQALGRSWHKLCFVCANCNKLLDSGSITEHGGDMFCNSCYRKNFGPKGYGFGGGGAGLSMDDGNLYQGGGNRTSHPDLQAAAYMAPRKTLAEANGNSRPLLHSGDYDDDEQAGGVYTVKKASSRGAAMPAPKAGKKKWGGAEECPRCLKSVFIAELMRGAGQAWHKACFTCNECNKRLDSSMLCEREGEIYCKSCYGRNFGPKGFGYGIGAGTLQMS